MAHISLDGGSGPGCAQTDATEQKRQRFEEMSKSWAIGTRRFKHALAKDHQEVGVALKRGFGDRAVLQQEEHDGTLSALLETLGKCAEDISQCAKAAPWKVAIAAEMKRRTTASNPWISMRLNMGSPFRLSRLVSACRRDPGEAELFLRKCAKCKV